MSSTELAFTVSIATSICLSLILAHYLDKHRWLYKKDLRKIWETIKIQDDIDGILMKAISDIETRLTNLEKQRDGK